MNDRTVAVAVVLAAVLAFATALTGTFVYDDVHSVAANPGVHSLGNLGRFFVDPTLFSSAGSVMYRPVLLCTFAVDHALGSGSPVPFKVTSVLLHATTALLVFLLLRRHGLPLAAAGLAAAWFAVHPLAGETVNMVSARSEGLFVAALAGALLCHRRLLDGPSRAAMAGVLLGAVVAVGSKETGVMVGPLLLVQEWLCRGVPRDRAVWGGLLRRIAPVVAIAIGYLLVRKVLLGQATAPVLGRDGSDPMYGHTRDLRTQLATMGAALPRVVAQALVPTGLGIDPKVVYHRSFLAAPVLCGWTCILLLTWLGLRRGRAAPMRCLGTSVAWATALPWIVLPLNLPLAEHRCYGPLVGFALVVASALARLRPTVSAPASRRVAVARRVAAGFAFAVLGALSLVQSARYRDEALLWQHALSRDPQSFRAHWGIGTVRMRRGEIAAAEPWLARSCALYPAFRSARRAWVECLLAMPDQGFRALAVAAELARQKDDDPYYRLLLANAELQAGIQGERRDLLLAAERTVLGCLDLGPPKATVYRLAAECRRRLGDDAGALAHLDAALRRGLDFPVLRAERSELLRALGREDEADADLRAAFVQAPLDRAVRQIWERHHAAPPK